MQLIVGGVESPLSDSELESRSSGERALRRWTSAMVDHLLNVSRLIFAQPTVELLRDFRQ